MLLDAETEPQFGLSPVEKGMRVLVVIYIMVGCITSCVIHWKSDLKMCPGQQRSGI